MQWFRVWNGTPNDPKFKLIARRSKRHITWVLAVFDHMMNCASEAEERGTLEGWDDEITAVCLDLETEDVTAIREAMQGLVLDGMRLSGWEKRQFASDDVAERVKRHRAKAKKTPPDGGSTNGSGQYRNGAEAEGNGDVTLHQRFDNVAETEKPLESVTLLPTPTLENQGGGGAGAREVAERVAGLTGLPAKGRNVATVEAWLTAGFDPDRDIYPAVAAVEDAAKAPIGSFKYFTQPIARYHAERTAPCESSNVRYLPSAAGGRRGMTADDAAARDLLAARADPNFDYGMGSF